MRGALSRPFLRLYALTLLYFSANSILNVIIPLKGGAMGASNASIGTIMGAYLFTTMLLRPWAGHMIQRFGPVRVLKTVLILNALALSMYTVSDLTGFLWARMLQGICTAFFSMSLQLGIIDALPEKDRSQGISMYSLCASMPGIIGPLLALGIWQGGQLTYFPLVLIGMAVLTGLAGFGARMDNGPGGGSPAGSEEVRPSMMASFSQLVGNPDLFRCSSLMLGASVVFGAVTAFVPLYASQIQQGSAAVYLMLQAGTVVTARFVLRSRIPSDGKWHPAFITGVTLSLTLAALCTSLAAAGGWAVFYAGALLMGLAQAMLYPALTSYLTFVLPRAERNVLLGLFIAMADLGVSGGGVLLGPVADAYSYSVMYGVCVLLGVFLTGLALRRVGR